MVLKPFKLWILQKWVWIIETKSENGYESFFIIYLLTSINQSTRVESIKCVVPENIHPHHGGNRRFQREAGGGGEVHGQGNFRGEEEVNG